MADNNINKKIDVDRVCTYLSHAFAEAADTASIKIGKNNGRGSKLYEFQVDFMYLLNEVKRGPIYITPKKIQEANNLIAMLEQAK